MMDFDAMAGEFCAKARFVDDGGELCAKARFVDDGGEFCAKAEFASKGGELCAKAEFASKGGELCAKAEFASKGGELCAKARFVDDGGELCAKAEFASKGGELCAKTCEPEKPRDNIIEKTRVITIFLNRSKVEKTKLFPHKKEISAREFFPWLNSRLTLCKKHLFLLYLDLYRHNHKLN